MKRGATFCLICIGIIMFFPMNLFAGGWGKLNWGMNTAQIEKIMGDKLLIVNEKKGNDTFSHKLQKEITIDQYQFEAFLNLTNDKLDRVLLMATGKEKYSCFLFLVQELEKKYGPPSSGPDEQKMSSGKIRTAKWNASDTLIVLNYAALIFQGIHETTNVTYYSRVSASSDKL
ncbi:MAG: hypothetical protein AB1641_09750 [Thermodesulfobacteriota bacterium]